jgi:hypothetical protein
MAGVSGVTTQLDHWRTHTRLHHGSHRQLLSTPSTPYPMDVDAIIVPTGRNAAAMRQAMRLAGKLDCTLMALCSKYSSAAAVAAMPEAKGIKLIAILRNPIDRAYSHYRMAVRRGEETRPFEKVISDRKNSPITLPETEAGEDSPYILSFGLYGRTLENYLRYFDRSQILILFQEDLLREPGEMMRHLFSFLEVNNTYKPPNLGREYHQGGVKRFSGLERWSERQSVLKSVAKRLLRSRRNVEALKFWFEQLNVRPVQTKRLSVEERLYLREIFEEDVALLERLFSISAPWEEFG